ncbi:hypothetical protein ACP70R_038389 [Stipagrostis hirtigluma subsp. patula]
MSAYPRATAQAQDRASDSMMAGHQGDTDDRVDTTGAAAAAGCSDPSSEAPVPVSASVLAWYADEIGKMFDGAEPVRSSVHRTERRTLDAAAGRVSAAINEPEVLVGVARYHANEAEMNFRRLDSMRGIFQEELAAAAYRTTRRPREEEKVRLSRDQAARISSLFDEALDRVTKLVALQHDLWGDLHAAGRGDASAAGVPRMLERFQQVLRLFDDIFVPLGALKSVLDGLRGAAASPEDTRAHLVCVAAGSSQQ